MKKNYFVLFAHLFTIILGFGQTVFINEIHYDNAGTDVNEGFEIAGSAGTDLTGYTVVLYRDVGTIYATINLSGIIPNQQNNLGTIWFPQSGIQNGPSDGMTLIASNGTTVIQFLSYQGTLTAVEGAANGMTSTDIGVSESSSTLDTESLQLKGTGNDFSNFTWEGPIAGTPGLPNTNQTLPTVQSEIAQLAIYPNPVVNGKFTITTKGNVTKKVSIYSLTGNEVYEKTIQPFETVNVFNLNTGIYMLRIIEDGKISTRKLVIK